VLATADRDYGAGRYPLSHPVLEDLFARILPARGHHVLWLLHSAQATSGDQVVPWHGSQVYLLPSVGARPARAIQHLLWRVLFLRRRFERMLRQHPIDVIQIRNDWVAALAAGGFERRHGIPVVFQWSFPHPLTHLARADDGLARYPGLARLRARVEQILYYRALRVSTHILPVSEWMAQDLIRRGVPAEKMTVFPLGFDMDSTAAPDAGLVIRQQYGLDGAPVVLYFGDMGRLRRLEFLLQAMRQVLAELSNARLMMVGAGDTPADLAALKAVAASLGIADRVVFTGQQPRSQIPAYIAAADVGVSPIRPIPLYAMSSPTKLVEMMGMACPVVANDILEQQALLARSGGGLCVPYEPTAFAEGVLWLLKHPDEARAMGRKGAAYVAEHRSLQGLADVIEDVYYRLLDRLP
jgi:glycosyltransferase involved in cell wall biosynthesis